MCRKDGLAVVPALAPLLAARAAHLPPDWSSFVNASSQSWLQQSRRSGSFHLCAAVPGCSRSEHKAWDSQLQDLAHHTSVMTLGRGRANSAGGITEPTC